MHKAWLLLLGLAVLFLPAFVRADDPARSITLVDGDRVVYLGNTFAERDANYGYLETELTLDNPNKSITFRNLGWSGDTVWGDARARFGNRADGFQHLKDHVVALKPTVILVAYGMNESFAGEPGLAEFEKGLNTLLDTLAETKAKVVLISPIRHENLGPPLPSPKQHNVDLRRYSEAIEKVAKARNAVFVDLYSLQKNNEPSSRLTDDGIHLTDLGYRSISEEILPAFNDGDNKAKAANWSIQLKGSEVLKSANATFANVKFDAHRIAFRATDATWSISGGEVVSDAITPNENYQLHIDGKDIKTIKAEVGGRCSWTVASDESSKRFEHLRAAINKKNELYFHRWRPQNETYLFGFRKHEQGNNGREIPLFDPLVAEMEAEIARLKKPVAHTYELIHEEAGK